MKFFSRRQSLDDFLEGLGPELRALPTPEPTRSLRDRIVASREAGVRTMLPFVSQSRGPTIRSTAAIALAAALMLLLVPIGVQRWNPRSPRADDVTRGFLGTLAYAQPVRGGDRPALDPVSVVVPERVRQMSLEFARRVRDSSGRVVSDSRVALDIAADSIANVAAWKIISEDHDARAPQPHVSVETTYVARADMRPLRRAIHVTPYSRFQRINVWQQFAGDSITGRMNTDGPSIGAGRGIARVLPRAFAPYLTETTAPTFLMGVPLARGWRGSASLLGWAVRDDDVLVPIELRVEGEETITIPAGRFDCWRLSIRFAGKQLDYWARTSDGLGVRVFDPRDSDNRTREVVLVRQ